jgi:hypothetical protein
VKKTKQRRRKKQEAAKNEEVDHPRGVTAKRAEKKEVTMISDDSSHDS